MKNSNSILIIIAIVAIVLVGGGLIYSLNQPDSNGPNEQAVDTQSSTDSESADTTTPTAVPDNTASSDQIIDGVTIPSNVLADIERDYPEHIIDDADRETRDDGRIEYEVELEHRDSSSDSDYKLTYDANWSLIKTERD